MKENTGLDCDTSYEWKAVALLALGFGFVGLDRFMVLPMFPVMMRDLGLTYPDLGLITGALSVAYGVSSLFMGGLSDKIGRRCVLIGAMLAFSILVGASEIATGLVMLVLIRTMIGLADGAYGPTSIVATLEASPPSRHGRNLGIQQMMMPLFGLGIAPIVAGYVAHYFGVQYTLYLAVIGFAVGAIICLFLKETSPFKAIENRAAAQGSIS